jgi:endoglucanase
LYDLTFKGSINIYSPKLKEWPYFWQQTEYVLGGGATNFMFLVLAAKEVLK